VFGITPPGQDTPANGDTPSSADGAHDDSAHRDRGAVLVQETPGTATCWIWHGTTDFVTHELRTELPDETTWWTIWAGDTPGQHDLLSAHATRDEAERHVERLRATEDDKLAANRFLRSLGHAATEHAATRADCNCDDCQPPSAASASAPPASDGTGQADRTQADGGPTHPETTTRRPGSAAVAGEGCTLTEPCHQPTCHACYPELALPAQPRPGREVCPGCGTARLLYGRTVCQACGVLVAMGRRQLPGMPAPQSRQARNAKVERSDAAKQADHKEAGTAVNTRWTGTCAFCHNEPPGPGGILCPSCRAEGQARTSRLHHLPSSQPDGDIAASSDGEAQPPPAADKTPAASGTAVSEDDDGDVPPVPGTSRARQLRDFAHVYLRHGLLPVPAWAAKANGECCCRRGADCPRPGKHPRSVHVGPGEHDYSWKPLACVFHAGKPTRA
jgi:hypothetical protein